MIWSSVAGLSWAWHRIDGCGDPRLVVKLVLLDQPQLIGALPEQLPVAVDEDAAFGAAVELRALDDQAGIDIERPGQYAVGERPVEQYFHRGELSGAAYRFREFRGDGFLPLQDLPPDSVRLAGDGDSAGQGAVRRFAEQNVEFAIEQVRQLQRPVDRLFRPAVAFDDNEYVLFRHPGAPCG